MDTVGRDKGPVQQEVLVSSLQGSGDDIAQGWCLVRQDCDHFVQVPVGRRDGDPGVTRT